MGRQGENTLPHHDPIRRPVHRVARLAGSAAMVAVALASMASAIAAQQPGADGPSKALEGRWRLELYLDKPSARVEPMAGQIDGEIAFSTMAWWNPRDRFGRHNLNLRSFFGNSFLMPSNVVAFGPGDTSMVSEVSGNVRGDSVGIDFIPRVDHGGLSLWGRFWGDSAKGSWYRRGSDGEGHFVLRRISKDPVMVASIPDGRPVAVAATPPKKLTKAEARALAKNEAAAKAKARADSIAVARADAKKKAHDAALAKAAARDSARAVALAAAKAKAAARDSAKAVALAEAKAKAAARDSANAVALADAKAKRAAATAGDSRTSRGGAPSTPVRVASATSGSRTAPNAAGSVAASLAPTPDGGATPSSGDPAAIPIRVRIFDEASKKYFVTTYSLHLPDGHWMYGQLRTGNGPDGFGPAVVRPPGKYEIEITNFMCGDKLWFFKDKILQPVVVTPGTPADVTINVNIPDAPARPSLDNKDGEKCAVPIS